MSPPAAAALGLLALVAGQDVEQAGDGTWRVAPRWPPTGSSRWSTPRPATCTSPFPSTATATRPTWPSSPRRASSPPSSSPRPTPPTPPGGGPAGRRAPGRQVLADGAYGSGEALGALTQGRPQPGRKAPPVRPRCPVALTGTTSPLARPRPPPAPPATPSQLTRTGGGLRVPCAGTARYERRCTRSPRTAAPCTCTPATPSSASPAGPGETAILRRITGVGGPWSSARSPGWWPTTTAGSVPGRQQEPPRPVIRAAAINLRRLVNLGLDHDGRVATQTRLIRSAQAQAVKEGPRFGHCPPGWPTSTLFASALRSDMS